jgi:hypothetical protein
MKPKRSGPRRRVLVMNCHEAWVHQLGVLDFDLDIVVGLKGRLVSGWDEQMRPVPKNARLISLEQALGMRLEYHCMIGHNISDLLDLKERQGPKILMLHTTIEGRMAEAPSAVSRDELLEAVATYVGLVRAHVVAVSELKGTSWQIPHQTVPCAVEVGEYLEPTRELARGLRISNLITRRGKILMWDFHQRAFAGLPLTLIGHNPDLGTAASRDWTELKLSLSQHRFFVHTAEPGLEDGYNMATLEAMAAGLPVLGNRNPTSPITHGVDGFLADDPAELGAHARKLLEDAELSARMGQAARETVRRKFPLSQFKRDFTQAIEAARARFHARK